MHAYNCPDPVKEPLFPSLPSCGSEPRRRHDWAVAARSAVKEGDEVETLHAGSDRDSDGVWPWTTRTATAWPSTDEDGDSAALGVGIETAR